MPYRGSVLAGRIAVRGTLGDALNVGTLLIESACDGLPVFFQ